MDVECVTVFQVVSPSDKTDRVVALIEYGEAWDCAMADICYFPKSDKMPVDKLRGMIAEQDEMRAWTEAHPGKFNLRSFLIHKMGR